MGELASTMDALAADDLHAMFGPQLLERLTELLRQSNRLAAEVAAESAKVVYDPAR